MYVGTKQMKIPHFIMLKGVCHKVVIAKPPKNCTEWPVEMINRKMTSDLVFDDMRFSLHNTVIMHANGPKCLRTE